MQRVVNLKQKLVNKMSYLAGNFSYLVDKGKIRKTNEDEAIAAVNCYGNVLLAVADGMGGANKGEYASSQLIKTVRNEFINLEKEMVNPKKIATWLNKVIGEVNEKLYKLAREKDEYKGMGTTLSLCFIVKDYLITAQVGDSRIYILKDNKMQQLSVDQTYAEYLLHTKKISEKEVATNKNRHVLTNAVGTKKQLNVDINIYPYEKEKLLLCSDGLYNNLSHDVIESILKGNDAIDRKCLQLISFGNANGGSDNMAVVIWESK